MEKYGLDLAHYYTSPGLRWDAFRKKMRVDLELLTYVDKHLFIERGMRGGISMVSKRHAKTNNLIVSGYDPRNPNKYIVLGGNKQPIRLGNEPPAAQK